MWSVGKDRVIHVWAIGVCEGHVTVAAVVVVAAVIVVAAVAVVVILESLLLAVVIVIVVVAIESCIYSFFFVATINSKVRHYARSTLAVLSLSHCWK